VARRRADGGVGVEAAARRAELRMLAAGACTVIGVEVTVVLAAGRAWFMLPALVATAVALVVLVWLAADALVVRSSTRERVRGSGGMSPMTQARWRH
jgi:hypothetical protein